MKTLFGILVLVGLVYAMFSGAMAMKSYYDISTLVDDVVPKEIAKLKSNSDLSGEERTKIVKDAVLKAAAKSEMALDPNGVGVTEEGGTLLVRINAPYAITVGGQKLVELPVSTTNSFTTR